MVILQGILRVFGGAMMMMMQQRQVNSLLTSPLMPDSC
jgi:hypothetical protein